MKEHVMIRKRWRQLTSNDRKGLEKYRHYNGAYLSQGITAVVIVRGPGELSPLFRFEPPD